jgi:methylthioribose-1-phosphate isomerase
VTTSSDDLRPIRWEEGRLRLLDQTRLPAEERWLEIPDAETMAEAIRSLRVRGAPAIGLAAAYGLAVEAARAVAEGMTGRALAARLDAAGRLLAATRPTARNLFWALEALARERQAWGEAGEDPAALARRFLERALALHRDDLECSAAMAAHGAALLPTGCEVLTHCNTGALATGGGGTALGVVRAAFQAGRISRVWATETRPLLQGARLTTWELDRLGIPHTLIVDSAAAFLMKQGRVEAVLVGADRIAANGDVANKIGTLALAWHARTAGIPFYVVAPLSTFDPALPDGAGIPIEERGVEEVVGWGGVRTAPEGTAVWSPAFDVTPAAYLTAIVTERGVISSVSKKGVARLLDRG